MKVKKIFAALLVFAMVVLLSACGDKTTAQSLLDGVPEMDPNRYQNIVFNMKSETAESGEGTSGAVSFTVGVEKSGNIWHVYDGAIKVGAAGFEMSFDLEGWVDGGSGVTYTKMSMFGQDSGWSRSTIDDTSEFGVDAYDVSNVMNNISGLWQNASTEPVLSDHGKNEDYIITYKIPETVVNNIMDSLGESGIGTGDLDVSMSFANDSKALKQVRVTGSSTEAAIDLSIAFRAINGDTTLVIPEDVISSAVDDSDSGFGLDSGFDSGFDAGIFDDWPEEDELYWADSDGQDELIDGMGLRLSRSVSSPDTIRVWHMSDYSELDFAHTGSGWHGTLNVRRYTTDEYGGAAGYFAGQRDFCAEYYPDVEPYFSNDTEVVYTRDGNELDMCRILNDGVTISAGIYLDVDEGSDDILLAKLGEILSMAGIQ